MAGFNTLLMTVNYSGLLFWATLYVLLTPLTVLFLEL